MPNLSTRYSLDAMVTKFTELLKTNETWTLLGNTIIIPRENAHSCATLAYELLKAGGIYNIITSGYSSSYSSVVAPDTLLPAIKAAKQAEIKKHPETINFDNNLSLEVTKENTTNSSLCRII